MRLGRAPEQDPEPNWPVVDGVPTEPYEMRRDPAREHLAKVDMDRRQRAREEADRTAQVRALNRLQKLIAARKGDGFQVMLLRRVSFEYRRRPANGGTVRRIEAYRAGRWSCDLAFWKKTR